MDNFDLENLELVVNQIERLVSYAHELDVDSDYDYDAALELDDILLNMGLALAARLDTFYDDYNNGDFGG